MTDQNCCFLRSRKCWHAAEFPAFLTKMFGCFFLRAAGVACLIELLPMHSDVSSSVFWTQRRKDSDRGRARRRSARGAEVSLPSASQGIAPSEVLTGANFSGLFLPSAGRLKEKLGDSRTEERQEALT